MNKPSVTAKDFFLWAGAMISLYWSVVAFLFLLFNYIDYSFPNTLSYTPDPYAGSMPYEMASIVVLFPVYLFLMWLIRRDISADPTRRDIWVRRWGIILTLFVAGATVAIDVIVLLTAFFRGEELTAAFLLKVLAVLLVGALAFMHFLADLRGYWDLNPKRRNLVVGAVSILALISIIGGFFIVGTPAQARLMRFDTQKVNDLQVIQGQVVNYWLTKQKIPAALSDLEDPLSGFTIPRDPQTKASYEYQATGALSFKLCAEFNRAGSGVTNQYIAMPVPTDAGGSAGGTWTHGVGHQCFTRSIDPERYPPVKR